MTHWLAELLLVSREDGALSPRGSAWLENHLSGCARCRAVRDRGVAMREALTPLRRAGPPPIDFDSVERAVRGKLRGAAPAGGSLPRPLMFAAAAAAVVLAIVIGTRDDHAPRPARTIPGPVATAEEERALTAGLVTLVQGSVFAHRPLDRGERRVVPRMQVREGTRIVTATRAAVVVQTSPLTGFRLEERTRAEIARLRDRDLRLTLLHGSVGSSVAPLRDEDRFEVAVGSLVVAVRGTRFSVSLEAGDDVAVEVLEGVVEVSRYEERTILRAPARAVFKPGAPLADAVRGAPEASPGALGAPSLNLRDRWSEALASLRVPGDRGTGGEVRVDGTPMGITPLLVLREPGPATVETIKAGEITRFEMDVSGFDVEPTTPIVAELPAPVAPAVGRLESAKIRRVVQSHRADVQRCYERRLKREWNLRDRVEMRFTVGADGHVTDARAQRGGANAGIVECLEAAVRSWTFDRPDGGPVTVVYPLSFAPAGASE